MMSVDLSCEVMCSPDLRAGTGDISLVTHAREEFLDMTEAIEAQVARSGVGWGFVLVQSHHTTTGVIVNENEPRLLDDFLGLLESWAPRSTHYRHDDLYARPDVPPDERPNGDAHARALLLGSCQSLAVADGALVLGRWQRVFFVELDGPRRRSVTVHVLGRPFAADRGR